MCACLCQRLNSKSCTYKASALLPTHISPEPKDFFFGGWGFCYKPVDLKGILKNLEKFPFQFLFLGVYSSTGVSLGTNSSFWVGAYLMKLNLHEARTEQRKETSKVQGGTQTEGERSNGPEANVHEATVELVVVAVMVS